MAKKPLPDPTKPYADFIYELMAYGATTVIADYAGAGGPNKRIWTVNVATHMAEGLKNEILMIGRTTRNGKEVSGYEIVPEAAAYWRNAREEGVSPEEALSGWLALIGLSSKGA